MRLLLLLDWSYPCDHQFLSKVYADNFPNRGHDVTWVMRPEDTRQDTIQRYSWNGMNVYTLPSNTFNPVKNYIRYRTKRIRKNAVFSADIEFDNFDLIHVRNDLSMGLVAQHIAQEWDIPFVHQISHLKAESQIEEYQRDLGSFTNWTEGQLGKRLRHTIASSADIVLPISKAMKSYLQNNRYEQPMEVLPTGAEIVEQISTQKDIRRKYSIESEFLLIYTGSMSPIRRLEFLFDVLNHLKQDHDVELLMMGGRSSENRSRLEQMAIKKGVESETTFTGWIEDRGEINSAIATADIGLSAFPTDSILRTNAPIKTLEYMSLGTPVVCTSTPDQLTVINESQAGIAVEYKTTAFANAIDQILSSPELKTKMGDRGKEYISNNRNFGILTDKVERIYMGVISDYE